VCSVRVDDARAEQPRRKGRARGGGVCGRMETSEGSRRPNRDGGAPACCARCSRCSRCCHTRTCCHCCHCTTGGPALASPHTSGHPHQEAVVLPLRPPPRALRLPPRGYTKEEDPATPCNRGVGTTTRVADLPSVCLKEEDPATPHDDCDDSPMCLLASHKRKGLSLRKGGSSRGT